MAKVPAHCFAVKFKAMKCSAVKYSARQCSAMQYSAKFSSALYKLAPPTASQQKPVTSDCSSCCTEQFVYKLYGKLWQRTAGYGFCLVHWRFLTLLYITLVSGLLCAFCSPSALCTMNTVQRCIDLVSQTLCDNHTITLYKINKPLRNKQGITCVNSTHCPVDDRSSPD